MKTLVTIAAISLLVSGAAVAENQRYNQQEQLEDELYGYKQSKPSASQPADNAELIKMSNQEQQEDSLHGYGKSNPSKSEPATVRVGRQNNQQEEDALYGYEK
ncbi:MAG: hypothetical protein GY703_19160 [Gammaproteobacteria bacterium]|nr:hypothetical protein [Gammaproteobacteria bacterium]